MLIKIKVRICCPKTTKFGPKLVFLFVLGQALLAHLVPCWWVGWWLWRRLYLARLLFTLFIRLWKRCNKFITNTTETEIKIFFTFKQQVNATCASIRRGETSAAVALII